MRSCYDIAAPSFGADHARTLAQAGRVAKDLDRLGRLAEAAKLLEQALAKWQATRGADNETCYWMQQLARVYFHMGRYAEAVKLDEQALALLQTKLGADNVETMTAMYNLADAYESSRRREEALKLFRECWNLRRAKLGPNNPDTIRTQMRMARSCQYLGRYGEALPLQEEALKLSERQLGSEDQVTIALRADLADSYGGLGRYADAVRLLREATPAKEKTAGPLPVMYDVACFHGMIAKYLLAGGKGAEVARQADAEAEEAVRWLRKAIKAGYSQPQHIKTDKDLDALRGREDFKKLLTELEAKAKHTAK
jgi:tetratricopeptide (TPR) repeat protein